MKILITGVAGFIGSNLADRLLKLGHNIIGIDDLSYGIKEQIPDGVDFYKYDIRDVSISYLFKDVDYVFHFAAKNCINDCQMNPSETIDINVNGTINIFEFSKIYNIKKVIFAESSAIYEGSDIYPTPETEMKPESFYAISKATTKMLSESYLKFYGLNYTALRYFCVYGPRQDYRRTIPPLFSSFIIKLLKGEQPTIYGTGEKRRDFIHIDDINDFHIQCINDKKTDNEIFNLGSGKNYSVEQIYNTISSLLKTNILPVYNTDLTGEAFQNLADISKAKNIGWKPNISLIKGLETSIDFIKNEINKGKI